jgi:hypothetical protein
MGTYTIANLRRFALAAIVLASVPLGTACYVEEDVAPPAYAEGYQPEYYDGYVVYYDDGGRPFYYANGGVVWISPASPYYARYAAHWNMYRPAYRGWYSHYGYRYHGYRHPTYRHR